MVDYDEEAFGKYDNLLCSRINFNINCVNVDKLAKLYSLNKIRKHLY